MRIYSIIQDTYIRSLHYSDKYEQEWIPPLLTDKSNYVGILVKSQERFGDISRVILDFNYNYEMDPELGTLGGLRTHHLYPTLCKH